MFMRLSSPFTRAAVLAFALLQGCLWRPALSKPVLRTELVYAHTTDGWDIAMHHYAPASPKHAIPVIICHGISANERMWSLDAQRSFPLYLAEKGWDVWAIDLRGVGESTRPTLFNGKSWNYSFDTFVNYDLPTVIAEVMRRTGATKVNWVGHSMGGMLANAYVATHGDAQFQTITTVAAPMAFDGMNRYFETGRTLAPLIAGYIPTVPGESVVASIAPGGRTFKTRIEYFFWNYDNMDEAASKAVMFNTIGNMASGVLNQLSQVFVTGKFTSLDGRVNYLTGLDRLTVPLHVVAGMSDNLSPVQNVLPGFDHAASQDKKLDIFGLANGNLADYGHVDLTVGDSVRNDVYPNLEQWMGSRQ